METEDSPLPLALQCAIILGTAASTASLRRCPWCIASVQNPVLETQQHGITCWNKLQGSSCSVTELNNHTVTQIKVHGRMTFLMRVHACQPSIVFESLLIVIMGCSSIMTISRLSGPAVPSIPVQLHHGGSEEARGVSVEQS